MLDDDHFLSNKIINCTHTTPTTTATTTTTTTPTPHIRRECYDPDTLASEGDNHS